MARFSRHVEVRVALSRELLIRLLLLFFKNLGLGIVILVFVFQLYRTLGIIEKLLVKMIQL
jgi:hypothetical protein